MLQLRSPIPRQHQIDKDFHLHHSNQDFIPVNIAIMTISDTRTLETDKSGLVLEERAIKDGHNVVTRVVVKDVIDDIVAVANKFCDDDGIDFIIATGGTGVTGRDVTPEAFAQVYEKEIPGFGEMFRLLSYKIIGTSTIQSRATAGVARGTYLFAVPGSPGACKDAWDGIFHEQLDIRHKPCNFVEMMPRLTEV